MRTSFVLLAVFGVAAPARLPYKNCTSDQVDHIRRLLVDGFGLLDVKEELPLSDVSNPLFTLFDGQLYGLQLLNISGDVNSLCDAKGSITDFLAVARKVRGHYAWQLQGGNPLDGKLFIDVHEATFLGRIRRARSTVRGVSLSFNHFNGVNVRIDGLSSFSVLGAKLIALGTRSFAKATRKTTRDVVLPALQKALQAIN